MKDLNVHQILQVDSFGDVIGLMKTPKRQGAKNFSYAQLAQKLGYKSPRSLAMVHKGQRSPSHNLVKKIAGFWSLTGKERDYVAALAEKSRASRRGVATGEQDHVLQKLRTQSEYLTLSESDLKALSNPLFMTIKQILQTLHAKGSKSLSVQEVSSYLINPAPAYQVSGILDHLVRLGLCQKNSMGDYEPISNKFLKTTSQIPSEAIRELHKKNLERTLTTLQWPVEQRTFLTGALSIKEEDFVKIKRRLEEFLFEVLEEFGEPREATRVVQLNLQMFQQTRKIDK